MEFCQENPDPWYAEHVAGIIGAEGDNKIGVGGITRTLNWWRLMFSIKVKHIQTITQ